MLAKKYRLSAKKDFSRIYKSRKTYNTPFFAVKYVDNGLPYSRLAVVVSKKTLPKATERNRARRIVRAILGPHWPKLKKHADIVVFIKKGILKIQSEQAKQLISDFLHQQRLL